MRWHKINEKKPETYPEKNRSLIIYQEGVWYEGWWNGTEWRNTSAGGMKADNVTHWAEVEPPTEGNTITE